MKAVEREILLALIIMIVVLVVLFIIIVNPSILFSKQTGEQITFREFCFHWSIVGYPKNGYPNSDGTLQIGEKYTYSISEYCAKAGAPNPATDPIDTCIKMCKATA